MDISVCVKVVRSDLVYQDKMHDMYTINPYDLLALQKAVELKEKCDCTVSCVSMGPEFIRDALVRSVAIGADEVYWLKDKAFAGSDTVATTYILSQGIQKAGKKDLIICGAEAVDGETGQISFGLARRLGYTCISEVEEIVTCKGNYIVIKTSSDDSKRMLKVNLPALLAFKGFTTVLENVSLFKLRRARNKELNEWDADFISADRELCGVKGSKTKVLSMDSVLVKKAKKDIVGSSEEKASQLHQILKGKGWR